MCDNIILSNNIRKPIYWSGFTAWVFQSDLRLLQSTVCHFSVSLKSGCLELKADMFLFYISVMFCFLFLTLRCLSFKCFWHSPSLSLCLSVLMWTSRNLQKQAEYELSFIVLTQIIDRHFHVYCGSIHRLSVQYLHTVIIHRPWRHNIHLFHVAT